MIFGLLFVSIGVFAARQLFRVYRYFGFSTFHYATLQYLIVLIVSCHYALSFTLLERDKWTEPAGRHRLFYSTWDVVSFSLKHFGLSLLLSQFMSLRYFPMDRAKQLTAFRWRLIIFNIVTVGAGATSRLVALSNGEDSSTLSDWITRPFNVIGGFSSMIFGVAYLVYGFQLGAVLRAPESAVNPERSQAQSRKLLMVSFSLGSMLLVRGVLMSVRVLMSGGALLPDSLLWLATLLAADAALLVTLAYLYVDTVERMKRDSAAAD